jgi:hypothetical protein
MTVATERRAVTTLLLGTILWPVLAAASVRPKPLQNLAEVRHFSRGVLSSIARVYFDGAWRNMRERTSIPLEQFDRARDRIAKHIESRVPVTGTITGDFPTLVREELVGDKNFEVEAILPFEKGHYRWILRYSKMRDGWLLSYFSIDGISGIEYPS